VWIRGQKFTENSAHYPLLAAHGGKMPEKEARQKMHLSKSQFSQLLASVKDYVELKPYHLDKRKKILLLK